MIHLPSSYAVKSNRKFTINKQFQGEGSVDVSLSPTVTYFDHCTGQ